MDTQIVEVRKNIIIPFRIVLNQSSYNFNINTVDFIPDEVNVKYINYATSVVAELGAVTLIYTDLVSDYIASFVGNVAIIPNSTFTLKKPIQGTYSFNMRTISNAVEDGRVGEFTMQLEFIKYKTVKPNKIY